MNRELIMSTLFERLQTPPLVYKFSADLTVGDAELAAVSDTSGLLVGMPVSGRGLQEGTTLLQIDPIVTLSRPATIAGTTVALVQGIAKTVRILLPIGEVSTFPTLCLIEGAEVYPSAASGTPRAASNQPQLVTLEPYCWLYAAATAPDAIPNQIVNAILDAVDKVMLPSDGRPWQNLGLRGVHHCRIEGRNVRAPGVGGTVSARLQFAIQVLQGIDTVPMPL